MYPYFQELTEWNTEAFSVCLICGKASCSHQKSNISISAHHPPLWKHSVFDFVSLMPPSQHWPIRTWTGEADNDRGAVPFCSVQIGLNCHGIWGVYRPGQRLFLIFLKPFLDGVSGLKGLLYCRGIYWEWLSPVAVYFSLQQCLGELYVCALYLILWPAEFFFNEKKNNKTNKKNPRFSKTSGHTILSN